MTSLPLLQLQVGDPQYRFASESRDDEQISTGWFKCWVGATLNHAESKNLQAHFGIAKW